MNPLVLVFFLHNVVATLLLGFKFRGRSDAVVKHFGTALVLNGIAFAVWSVAVVTKPQSLENYITVGALFFVASLVAFLAADLQSIDASKRRTFLMAGGIVALILFLARSFVYQSQPYFSPEGLFFFNPHPVVQLIYVFGLAFAALPAVDALASKFSNLTYSRLVRYGFVAEVMGGLILITSTNAVLLYLTGWIIGGVYLVLWTSLLFSKKAWEGMS